MTLQNRMKQAKTIVAKDPKSQDPRVLEMKDRIATARKESAAKKNKSNPATQEQKEDKRQTK